MDNLDNATRADLQAMLDQHTNEAHKYDRQAAYGNSAARSYASHHRAKAREIRTMLEAAQ